MSPGYPDPGSAVPNTHAPNFAAPLFMNPANAAPPPPSYAPEKSNSDRNRAPRNPFAHSRTTSAATTAFVHSRSTSAGSSTRASWSGDEGSAEVRPIGGAAAGRRPPRAGAPVAASTASAAVPRSSAASSSGASSPALDAATAQGAGAGAPAAAVAAAAWASAPAGKAALTLPLPERKEYEYPAPVVVKNTFIETPIGRPPSLDGFFEERRIQSAPGSGAPSPSASFEPRGGLKGALEAAAEVPAGGGTASDFSPTYCAPAVPLATSPFSPHPQVLLLADTLKEPELGTPELPTLGSRSHRLGSCKPCAFMHTKGCENGVECPFCHLCKPGEKKRRQKDKFVQRREATRVEQAWQSACAWAGGMAMPAVAAPAVAPGIVTAVITGTPPPR